MARLKDDGVAPEAVAIAVSRSASAFRMSSTLLNSTARSVNCTRRVRLADQNPFLQPKLVPETAREAVLALDHKFPWLRGVERRTTRWPRATPPPAAEII